MQKLILCISPSWEFTSKMALKKYCFNEINILCYLLCRCLERCFHSNVGCLWGSISGNGHHGIVRLLHPSCGSKETQTEQLPFHWPEWWWYYCKRCVWTPRHFGLCSVTWTSKSSTAVWLVRIPTIRPSWPRRRDINKCRPAAEHSWSGQSSC